MGGRGASSGAKGKISGTNASGQPRVFYDKTSQFQGMSIHEFENAVRGRKQEYIGGFDKNGKLVVAGTSNNKGAVAVPTGHPDFKNITTLTHNHPSDANRPVGGTFSEADVKVLGKYKNLNSVRAVANGKSEHSYIMQKSSNRFANHAGLFADAVSAEKSKRLSRMGYDAVAKFQKNVGRPLTTTEINSAYIGGMKNAWKDIARRNGFDYVPLKKAPW